MMILITGGSKCGKSSLAERILEGFSGDKYYIATMQPYGEDAQEAIARHRKMREGKGFETIERYTDIGGLVLPDGCAVLLECMGNLCANEMFRPEGIRDPAETIVRDVLRLSARTALLVIVTNQVGNDGISYAPETMEYIRILGKVNARLAAAADCAAECVFGIPVILKGHLPC